LIRHARACRGHPRIFIGVAKKDVDGRIKSGHDGSGVLAASRKPAASPKSNEETSRQCFFRQDSRARFDHWKQTRNFRLVWRTHISEHLSSCVAKQRNVPLRDFRDRP